MSIRWLVPVSVVAAILTGAALAQPQGRAAGAPCSSGQVLKSAKLRLRARDRPARADVHAGTGGGEASDIRRGDAVGDDERRHGRDGHVPER